MASKKKPAEDFETLYGRLEGTVRKLEEGGLTLDQSVALYEEGMKVARRCQELLQSAELRITKLQAEFASLHEQLESYTAEAEEEEEIPLE